MKAKCYGCWLWDKDMEGVCFCKVDLKEIDLVGQCRHTIFHRFFGNILEMFGFLY
ncbi:MAG: hypothetical protein WC549_09675 [Actinomycetota bacterium]